MNPRDDRKNALTMVIDARRHVNKMCMAAGVPLVESGTAGYLGQVQPILKVRKNLSLTLYDTSDFVVGPN